MTGTGKPGAVTTTLAMVLAVALLVLLTAGPAETASRYKVVTRTFSSNTPIVFPSLAGPAAPFPSDRKVGGFDQGKILDVNLTLKNFSHAFPDDVDMMLSHRGINRTVFSDVGGSIDANNIIVRLDDEAASPLPGSTQLSGGTFKPTDVNDLFDSADTFPFPAPTPSGLRPLSGFDGSNPNRPWSLWAVDDTDFDLGQFAGGWSITIKARVLR